MPLDEQAKAVLDAAYSNPQGTAFDTRDPAEARRRYGATTQVFAPPTPELAEVRDFTIPGPGGDLPIRLYRPTTAEEPAPVLVFYHGGGWVFGDLETHDHVCRALAHEAGCLILSADYRLAPEHRFPAAVEDSVAALRWAADHVAELGGDAARLAVGGDSAGGNLAAVAALQARDDGGPDLCFQLLIYPATDFTADNASLRDNGEGYLLDKGAIEYCRDTYLRGAEDMRDPRASPLLAASLAGLPPAMVMTAEFDPLRDEGRAYARALRDAGVEVDDRLYDGMIHGFLRMGGLIDRANKAIGDAAAALRAAFSRNR